MKILIFQIALVLLSSLACGRVGRMLGQNRVIGEIFGGILIGPSVFGRAAPHLFASIFPQGSLGSLESLSNLGLILFLLLIGSEVDHGHLRQQKATAIVAGLASIFLPFGIAFACCSFFYTRFPPSGIGKVPFAIFLAISMSITAFPVLARILEGRDLQSSPLGATALLCAAIGDLAAWILLAVAITLIPSSGGAPSSLVRLLWLALYLAVMVFAVKPLCRWLAARRSGSPLSHDSLGVVIAVALISSAVTDAIGIHALFGAFLAGLCFPRVSAWQQALRRRLEDIISLVLLPLFFALTGLRTRLELLSDSTAWLWVAFIIFLAASGKIGGAVFGARLTGQTWRFSLALGVLLNTRGLVELIVLNIAYNAHVFSPTLYTMLVVMALVTTTITVPILDCLKVPNPSKGTAVYLEQSSSRSEAK